MVCDPVIYIVDMPPAEKTFSARMRREILAAHLGVDQDALVFDNGAHGKPVLREYPHLHFSVSHSGTIWAMALDAQNIGLDIERHRPRKYMQKIIADYFHAEEQAYFLNIPDAQEQMHFFYDLWTKKEAYGKFLGLGLHYDFAAKSFLDDTPVTILTQQYENLSLSVALSNPCDWDHISIRRPGEGRGDGLRKQTL